MAQAPVTIQRIWGAFTPTTNIITGVTTSGEAPYQSIPNELITSTFAGVRTATNAATNSILTLGKVTQGDGAGAQFSYNPTDTTSGCIAIGSSAGTVLNLTSIISGTVVVGFTVASSVTGAPLATVVSFGTGAGGTGTYNLSGPVNQPGPFTFLLDNNSTILVSADGSRWYLNNQVATGPFTFNAPSGNPAIQLTTPTYTFGNATDNPNFVFAGSGSVTMPRITGPTAVTGNFSTTGGGTITSAGLVTANNGLTVAGAPFTSRGFTDNATANALTISAGGLVTASAGMTVSGGNFLSRGITDNATTTIFQLSGTAGTASIQGYGNILGGFVDMTPDTGTATVTLTGCTTSPTGTIFWNRIGPLVVCVVPAVTGTSNSTGCSLTGFPTSIQPTRNQNFSIPISNGLINAGVAVANGGGEINGSVMTFYVGGSSSGFTNTATSKGVQAAFTVAWMLT